MARVSKIKYNPSLSVAENARLNNCTVDAIRYYIRTRGIDRRYEGKMNIIEDIKKYLQVHPSAKKAEVARETKHGINQVKKYWDAAIGESKTSQFKSGRNTATKIKSKFEEDKRLAIANKKELASELLKEADKVLQYVETVDVSALRNWLMADQKLPLICVGSGGKHTPYPALLYQMMASIAKAVTPLEFSTISPEAIKNSKILLLSSSGKNIDIKYATKRALKYNPKNTACLTFTDSEDNEIVKKLGKEKSFVFKNEFKDGFISIRSKILTYALLYKAFSGDGSLAKKLRTEGSYTVEINKMGVLPAWSQIKHYNVIYGSYGEPVAHDVESPMVEGGIASVQLCDYKNFCHGRFIFGSNHCSNKKVKKTDVCTILLISPREEFLAKKVRELVLPDNMPVVEIRTELDNPLASIQLLIDALTFVFDLAEKQLGINPNSPPNYSSIDKRVPISGVHYEAELKRFGELHYGDSKPKPLAKKSEKVRDTTRYELVTILDGMPFKPYEEFNIPVMDCIQFHSEALPENQILSNHYDCIIRFRDCEFYSLEQMFLGLTYSESPEILREIMNCKSGIRAKGLCRKKYENDRDWDFEQKQYRIIALCHLYKYLSVKEYRDRLRETYPQTLVECPNGTDYEFGLVQNLETNIFEGNNCSGRTTMIVRDMMLKLETKAIQEKEAALGRTLTDEEREAVVEEVCARVRAKYDSDEVVLKDSQKLFDFIESENIAKIKKRRPKKFVPPVIDRSHRCLVLDFDFTIFDTSVDDSYRKVKRNRDLKKAQELIPEYKLYDGWREVFEWCKKNDIKIGVISEASRELIVEKAFKHFDIPFDYVVGARPYIGKPNPILGNILMGKLNIREEQMVYVGDSLDDEIQARSSKLLFYGATWHNPEEEPFTAKGIQTISDPREIIKILENITIGE